MVPPAVAGDRQPAHHLEALDPLLAQPACIQVGPGFE
jgi:hypothetical protein